VTSLGLAMVSDYDNDSPGRCDLAERFRQRIRQRAQAASVHDAEDSRVGADRPLRESVAVQLCRPEARPEGGTAAFRDQMS
jgi:hypothetical protein